MGAVKVPRCADKAISDSSGSPAFNLGISRPKAPVGGLHILWPAGRGNLAPDGSCMYCCPARRAAAAATAAGPGAGMTDIRSSESSPSENGSPMKGQSPPSPSFGASLATCTAAGGPGTPAFLAGKPGAPAFLARALFGDARTLAGESAGSWAAGADAGEPVCCGDLGDAAACLEPTLIFRIFRGVPSLFFVNGGGGGGAAAAKGIIPINAPGNGIGRTCGMTPKKAPGTGCMGMKGSIRASAFGNPFGMAGTPVGSFLSFFFSFFLAFLQGVPPSDSDPLPSHSRCFLLLFLFFVGLSLPASCSSGFL
mmetsp:Transcript_4211/g.7446  ORF Transcript_4211/g.7446 Transcript_4211/m.7446 type:complete len:309 (-) Transcript_4211:1023-1949(-)